MVTLRESGSGVTFTVKLVPRAHENRIAGVDGDALKVRLNAPPVEGRANAALLAFLADALGVHRAQIEIIAGHAARRKVLRVRGVTAKQIEKRLAQG